MTNVVYRSPTGAGSGGGATYVVYESPLNAGGTLYTKAITATETPVASIVIARARLLVITAIQQAQPSITKLLTVTKLVTQTPLNSIITAATLLGSVATVSQQPIASVQRTIRKLVTAAQTGVASIIAQFISGSSHSTLFITISAVQQPVAIVIKGIQTIKSASVRPVASVGKLTLKVVAAVQQPVVTVFKYINGVGVGNVIYFIVSATQTPVASVQKMVKKTMLATQHAVASIRVNIERIADAGVRKVSGLMSAIGRMMGR